MNFKMNVTHYVTFSGVFLNDLLFKKMKFNQVSIEKNQTNKVHIF